MSETPFIITIDTEGDDLWARPREITTRNAEYLPRFQSLCERFRFKPVYLTNYEMAMSDVFVEFARDVLARGAGEIGMHLHAWNSPPLEPLTSDDFRYQPYLIEYPERVMKEKIKTLTRLLEERFDQADDQPSRRALGVRRSLCRHAARRGLSRGLLRDPGCRLARNSGRSGRERRLGLHGLSRSALLPRSRRHLGAGERRAAGSADDRSARAASTERRRWAYRIPLLRRVANRVSPGLSWLCPVAALERQPRIRCCKSRAKRAPRARLTWSSCCIPRSSCRAAARLSGPRRISTACTSTWRCCSRSFPPGAAA